MAADNLEAKHWDNFLYKSVARHWHSLWCRWGPSGELLQKFKAERIFTPNEKKNSSTQRNVYHYEDDRGTVKEGRLCGPWEITEEHSGPSGVVHPARDAMTTIFLPGGPCAWCPRKVNSKFFGAELFLHHGDDLRMSVGIIYNPDGTPKQLSLIREDARGPFPSSHWSSSIDAQAKTPEEFVKILAEANAPLSSAGAGVSICSGLVQESLSLPWEETRAGKCNDEDVILLCAECTAIICPKKVVEGESISCAGLWWMEDVLYIIEANWDANGDFSGVRHIEFRNEEKMIVAA